MKTDLFSQQPTPRHAVALAEGLNHQLREATVDYFAMQTFFGSVKKRNASSPPSRPTPLCFIPPKGTRSRAEPAIHPNRAGVDLLCDTMSASQFCVHTLEARP